MTSEPNTPTPKAHAPFAPGEILLEEFLKPMGISQYKLAKAINVPPRRINEIVHGTRKITPDTGIRLSRDFDMSENFWVNLQMDYDIEMAKEQNRDEIEAIRPIVA